MRPAVGFAAVAALLFTALAVGGCASTDPAAARDLAPRALTAVQAVSFTGAKPLKPTVAVVLGGGGLRGFAHVGVLRALEEAGLRPDLVVGTSAGAVVGAAYASGMRVEQIRETALAMDVMPLLDFTWRSGGFIRGDRLAQWVDTLTGGVPMEAFPIRFAAVATDMQHGRPVLLDHGAAGRAVQASSAVPGVNVPVSHAGGHLVDGGVTSLVPVRFARALGADVVIAVDIYCQGPGGSGLSVPAVMSRVLRTQSCLVAAPEMAEADVLIAPTVTMPGMFDRAAQARVIEAGHEAARVALGEWQRRPAGG
ncbi:MAG: patatin-like phospholipase family protein [Hydrogenophaga sp.]|nr:patatin-like phospholipase family protein [Hydrogenophaga sp.]